ncbi:MAG: hypothetical protein NC307_11365 [Roseburia sp.]|nr:hypothetical protein [Roseburia sp.]
MTEILTQAGVQNMTSTLGILLAFIGVCAFLASIVTEGLKSIDRINRIPTKLVCYIVSLILTPMIFCTMMAYMNHPVEWFMVFASFLASFVVAKVSMNGWDDVTELAQRLILR